MTAYKLTIRGLVQGVGFRPFIAELAEKLNICGTVKNAGGIVIIYAQCENCDEFIACIKAGAPRGAKIISIEIQEMSASEFSITMDMARASRDSVSSNGSFYITKSDEHQDVCRVLPPDLPICDACARELLTPGNRRYRYPFISCAGCGPRFTIMHDVPYDRETTTMDRFQLCQDCRNEYTQKGNIRRHAQTISCHQCGPQLRFKAKRNNDTSELFNKEITSDIKNGTILDKDQALRVSIDLIKGGKVGAVLDIGGFHFVFDPYNREPAQKLRQWKDREAKPFAVMFPNMEAIREICDVSTVEEKLLTSDARPIVLLKYKKNPFVPEICAGSDRIGAMLPCSPLQILLLEACGPLVMTSGNRGGEPIVIDPTEMEDLLGTGGPEFMLYHDRQILTPLDDSIYQVIDTRKGERVQVLRRARGIVPSAITMPLELSCDTIAQGGDLKAVFALGRKNMAYLSGHFGDLEWDKAQKRRLEAVNHMERLLDIHPEKSVGDMHPRYISARGVQQSYQHHMAHIASVICEHDLKQDVIGFAFDGTGYGVDDSIWGSEVFRIHVEELCGTRSIKSERVASLTPVKMIGGDSGSKDADRTLACYLTAASQRCLLSDEEIEQLLSIRRSKLGDSISIGVDEYKMVYAAITHDINTIVSTSMGRFFDAVSALLGICLYNSYEGQCPIELESAAWRAYDREGWDGAVVLESYKIGSMQISCECVLENNRPMLYIDAVRFLADLVKTVIELEESSQLTNEHAVLYQERLALMMHQKLSDAVIEVVKKVDSDMRQSVDECCPHSSIALAGGTFLNRMLTRDCIDKLDDLDYHVFLNREVPPGDGGISLGQLFLSGCQVDIDQ